LLVALDSSPENTNFSKVPTRKKVGILSIVGNMKEISRRRTNKIGPSHISAKGKYATKIEVNTPLDLERKDSSVRVTLPLAFFAAIVYIATINIPIAITTITIVATSIPLDGDRDPAGIDPLPLIINNAIVPILPRTPSIIQIVPVSILLFN